MNVVDTSKEKVAQGWQMIEAEFSLQDVPADTGEAVSGEHIPNSGDAPVYGEAVEYVMTDEERAEKERDMSKVLVHGMTMAFAMLRIKHVPDNVKEDFANSWAVVIVKRFPENPVGEFYKEYADLIAAGGSTLVLIGAIRESKAIDRREANNAIKGGLKEAELESSGNG